MAREKWYIMSLMLATILLCLIVLSVRWSVLARRVPLEIYQPTLEPAVANPDQASDSSARKTIAEVAQCINLNRATASELEQLAGIGPVLAKRIVEYRERNGGFKAVDELLHIEGIGSQKLAAIRDKVYVESSGENAAGSSSARTGNS